MFQDIAMDVTERYFIQPLPADMTPALAAPWSWAINKNLLVVLELESLLRFVLSLAIVIFPQLAVQE